MLWLYIRELHIPYQLRMLKMLKNEANISSCISAHLNTEKL